MDAILDSRMESFPLGVFCLQEDFIIKLHSLFQKKEDDLFPEYVPGPCFKIKQADSADT